MQAAGSPAAFFLLFIYNIDLHFCAQMLYYPEAWKIVKNKLL